MYRLTCLPVTRRLTWLLASVAVVNGCDCGTPIVPIPQPDDAGHRDAGPGDAGPVPVTSCTDSTVNGAETDVDCGGPTCTRCRDGRRCLLPSDCFSGICTAGVCTPGPTCSDMQRNGSETDVDCGGPICPRCMVGQQCSLGNDCFSGLCDGGACAPTPTCSDLQRNGTETDVDCGGPTCVRCADGKSCSFPSDCFSGICTANKCAPQPTCIDQQRNGMETDVDCGGPVCPRCMIGRMCLVNTDCLNGSCTNLVCTAPPACTDGMKNGFESDVDCGGPFCPACAVNRTCNADGDCVSGECSDRLFESDGTWKQTIGQQAGWEQLGFNDSAWSPAFVQEPWGNSQVWGTSPPMPAQSRANWIWYRDSRTVGDSSVVFFRKTFVGPPVSATLHISVDDVFTAYLNGAQVASGTLWYNTVTAPLTLTPGAPYVLAVRAQNNSGAGGVVADVRLSTKSCRPTSDAGVPDAGIDAGIADAGALLVLPAIDRAYIDEEFPNTVRNTRLHIRDDAQACGGLGAVRSIARWDVSQVTCTNPGAVHVRWIYAHDFNQYGGGPRQVSVHALTNAWSGNTVTWSNAPSWDPTPVGVMALDDVPDASIYLPVSLDAGVNGLMLKFSSETCPPPRWPAEIGFNPVLEVQCP